MLGFLLVGWFWRGVLWWAGKKGDSCTGVASVYEMGLTFAFSYKSSNFKVN